MSKKAETPEAPQEASVLIEVTLVKPHTHKGKQLALGGTINVSAAQKAWLESQGVIGEPQQEAVHG